MINEAENISVALERIRNALIAKHSAEAIAIVNTLHPADQAELYNLLDETEREFLLANMDIPATADLMEEMENSEVLDVAETLTTDRLADLLDEMEPDAAADLLGDMSPSRVSAVLAEMEDANDVLPLLGYPDESAGGLMTTSFIALRRHTSVDQAIKFLRDVSPEAETPYYLFVVDREKRLIGVVGLRELVVSKPETIVESIMDTDVIYVTVGTDQEEAARVLARYDLASLPVVDEQHHLVGVITHDDIVEVIEEEATEDILRLGAVETGALIDKPYWAQRISDVVRSRFLWLLVLFVAETFTGTVLRHFEGEIKTVVSLSFFIPLLIGTGGNAGSQTVATVIRALALREVHFRDILRVWWREVIAGVLLGLLIGVVGFIRALIWGVSPELAITVSVTIAVICVWATTVAALIPIAASAMKIDPTLISGPLMATLIDGTGLIIYFSLAALILPQLK